MELRDTNIVGWMRFEGVAFASKSIYGRLSFPALRCLPSYNRYVHTHMYNIHTIQGISLYQEWDACPFPRSLLIAQAHTSDGLLPHTRSIRLRPLSPWEEWFVGVSVITSKANHMQSCAEKSFCTHQARILLQSTISPDEHPKFPDISSRDKGSQRRVARQESCVQTVRFWVPSKVRQIASFSFFRFFNNF